MRVVIQRVSEAKVASQNNFSSSIGKGLVILVGIEHRDNHEDADWLAKKIVALRIFDDDQGVMNHSLLDVGGALMVVSQFTLHARTKKGNRPSYIEAAPPDKSVPLYNYFIKKLENLSSIKISTGVFGAQMKVALVNDGPVTIIMDTHNKD